MVKCLNGFSRSIGIAFGSNLFCYLGGVQESCDMGKCEGKGRDKVDDCRARSTKSSM